MGTIDANSKWVLVSPRDLSLPLPGFQDTGGSTRTREWIRNYGAFIRKEIPGGGESHYHLRLLQAGGLLLKNCGKFR